ncbi:putative crossover junction endonuclease EME2 [Gossypium arboreum]|uniref:Putative crossover junction endonuclease EME2 n=1 Tax=Gossypium arboreum TaxID=29729 RepID=A0A0B0MZ46_GOSAR|nr:putative crossover junction endonuclease EME2 [Gossypium arboreum]
MGHTARSHAHVGRPCVTHGLDRRPCAYPWGQIQGYFQSHFVTLTTYAHILLQQHTTRHRWELKRP